MAIDLRSTFDWLAEDPDTRDPAFAEEIKTQLVDAWGEIREQVGPTRFDPVLGAIYAGRFSNTVGHAWAQTNDKGDSDLVNLTLELAPDELSINTVGWFKPQFDRLNRWLGTGSARRLFREIPDWEAVIFLVAGNVGKGGKVVFQGAGGSEIERLPLSEIHAASLSIHLNGLKPKLAHNEHLGLHLRRSWSRDQANAASLREELGRDVERWLEPLAEMRVVA